MKARSTGAGRQLGSGWGSVLVATLCFILAACSGTAGQTTTSRSSALTWAAPPSASTAGRVDAPPGGRDDASVIVPAARADLTGDTPARSGAQPGGRADRSSLMPDVTGVRMDEARRLLSGAPVRLIDPSGLALGATAEFAVVCAQTPPAGAPVDAAAATLTVAPSPADC